MASFGAQRGNTFVGFILGLIVGLTIALVVAIYVTKVPIPFLNKGLSRNAEQDAAEEKKNKDWDPNAPLYGKTPSPPKLALSGYDPKISERDQAGKMVYRVRLGPFESKTEAEQIQAKLKATKVESALIRVQR